MSESDDHSATKMCPFCLAEVPGEASRCRHCTGDFAQRSESSSLAGLWIGGTVLAIIGLAVVGNGDSDSAILGFVALGIGGILIQAAIIAWGVSLGMRDHDHQTHVGRYTNAARQTETTV